MRKKGVNAEQKIKSLLEKIKHADQATLVSRTRLDKSSVSKALRRLSKKHEIEPMLAFSDPGNPDKLVQEWQLNRISAMVENLSTENPKRTLSNAARNAYLCAMIRNALEGRRMLIDQRFSSSCPAPSVTIAASERALIDSLARQFESDFNSYGYSVSASAIRASISLLLKTHMIEIRRVVMLTSSNKLDETLKRFQAEAVKQSEADWLKEQFGS